jgi:hypothetical protein
MHVVTASARKSRVINNFVLPDAAGLLLGGDGLHKVSIAAIPQRFTRSSFL